MKWHFDKYTRPWALKQVTGNTMPIEDAFQKLSKSEYNAYASFVGNPLVVLDLAAGLGRVSVYLNHQKPGAKYILADADVLNHEKPRYGWNTHDEFYSSFLAANLFCNANGLKNPTFFDITRDDWFCLHPDLIISMLGIGFHVPMEEYIVRLHCISKPNTVIIFGAGGVDDFPDWERQHDFSQWFSDMETVKFSSEYPTHEGRIAVLKGRV